VFVDTGLSIPLVRRPEPPRVAELRALSLWSEGQVWCSPERHGAVTGIMKAQVDWLPLEQGGVRPTQGRTLAVMQVSGGSQSFNAVNGLRLLGRWMLGSTNLLRWSERLRPLFALQKHPPVVTDLFVPESRVDAFYEWYEATVGYYNHHAGSGADPLFHKAPRWLRPLEPPLGAIELGDSAFMSFTLGGLHTDTHGRVLDLGGDPIPGLYGAGRSTSGIPGWGYCSGMSLGDGTFFGRRAGLHLAGPVHS